MKIAIGSDHAGFEYKNQLINFLHDHNIEVKDFGTSSTETVDYPDFAHPVASAVDEGDFVFGILICGSGNGVAITANKHAGIRAALAWNKETATLARKHNNANILCLPARFVTLEEAKEIVHAFLHNAFEGGRHAQRIEKIEANLSC